MEHIWDALGALFPLLNDWEKSDRQVLSTILVPILLAICTGLIFMARTSTGAIKRKVLGVLTMVPAIGLAGCIVINVYPERDVPVVVDPVPPPDGTNGQSQPEDERRDGEPEHLQTGKDPEQEKDLPSLVEEEHGPGITETPEPSQQRGVEQPSDCSGSNQLWICVTHTTDFGLTATPRIWSERTQSTDADNIPSVGELLSWSNSSEFYTSASCGGQKVRAEAGSFEVQTQENTGLPNDRRVALCLSRVP